MDLQVRKFILVFGDILLLYGTLFATLIIRFGGTYNPQLFFVHALPFSFLYVFWIVIFYIFDLYNLSIPPKSTQFLTRYVVALIVMFGIGVLFFYSNAFTTTITPKTNLFIHVILFGVFAYFWRYFFSTTLSSLIPWRIGVFACDPTTIELQKIIQSHSLLGYECVLLPFSTERLASQIVSHRLQVVVLSSEFMATPEKIQELYECLETGVIFFDLAQAYEIFSKQIPLHTIDQRWFIRNIQETKHSFFHYTKRGLDIIVSCLVLIITIPFWLLIALAIKIEDKGKVFYFQDRVGKFRVLFRIIKFRTMRTDAEEKGRAQWAKPNDSRVTRAGKILRRTHLDELPQMLNVLKGDISLIGPRPERPEFVVQLEREIPHYAIRHLIQPGFTGWAQISFRYARSVTDSQKKFEYDLYYIKNRSLVLDVLILLKTIRFFFRKGE